jgi:hypothetical protein
MNKRFDIVVDDLDSEFTVHRHGCRDVKKSIRRGASHFYTVEAESATEAVKGEVAAFQENEQDWYEKDFRIMPCCGD